MQITYIKRHYTRAPSGEVSSVLAVPLVNLDVGEVGGQFLPDFFEFLFIFGRHERFKNGPDAIYLSREILNCKTNLKGKKPKSIETSS